MQSGASEYDALKLINYIRAEVSIGRDHRSLIAEISSSSSSVSSPPPSQSPPAVTWNDDYYLTPVLENDEYLLHDWEDIHCSGGNTSNSIVNADNAAAAAAAAAAEAASLLEDMRQLALEDPSVRELLLSSQGANVGDEVDNKATSSSRHPDEKEKEDIDARYFDSYSFFDIHRTMLSDKVRTDAYLNALERNPLLLKGATVLDVGCGTGVLSMFAARGGAAQVIAVDGSPEMASFARKICAANGFGGEVCDRIGVVSSKLELVESLPGINTPDGKVDVLVSEWMGYALLFESMLDSVLIARDRFLRPGGAILPDIANIYVAAADSGAAGLEFWNNVYGLDMSVVGQSLRTAALKDASVCIVKPDHLISEGKLLVSLDVATMKPSDQDFTAEFELKPGAGPRVCTALILWFDTLFSDRFCKETPVTLPTGPYDTPTHWAQTVLELPTPVTMAPAAVALPGVAFSLKGRISMARRKGRHRTLDISVEYRPVYADGTEGEFKVQLYAMGVGL